MTVWASIVALVVALLAFLFGDPMTVLGNIAELVAVVAVFALVCASEAWT